MRCMGGRGTFVRRAALMRVSDTGPGGCPVLDVLMWLYRPLDRRGTPRVSMVPPPVAAM
ncbi:hypothetical protein GCM10009837_76260 [Streptomyces durmitorensis]